MNIYFIILILLQFMGLGIDLARHGNVNNLCLCTHKEHLKIHRSIEKLIPYLLEKKIIFFDKEDKQYKIVSL